MFEVLLALLMFIPAHKTDTETREERVIRMSVIARAILVAVDEQTCRGKFKREGCNVQWEGSRKSLIVRMVTQGEFETHFAELIHAGKCKRYECDPKFVKDVEGRLVRGADGKPRIMFLARGPWQVQARIPGPERELWKRALGNDQTATTAGARLAARYMARRECGGNVVHMFQSQDGRGCRDGERGRTRAFRYNQLMKAYDRQHWKLKHARGAAP